MFLKFNAIAFFLLLINGIVYSKTIDGTDSILVKKYWNRIHVKSLSSLNNNLYVGIDNYLQLVCPDEESATFQYYLTTNNGDVYDYEEGTFLTIPVRTDKSFISIHIITEENDTILVGKKQLAVALLPIPVLKMGNTVIKDQCSVDKKVFYTGDSLKLFFTEDLPESSSWYKIEYFSIGYNYSKVYVSIDNASPVFQKEAFGVLEKLKSGAEMVIKINSVSPAGLLRNLPLVRFKVY